jgi:hypothetical protein
MLSHGHHTVIFIISMFMLLLLNELLAKLSHPNLEANSNA